MCKIRLLPTQTLLWLFMPAYCFLICDHSSIHCFVEIVLQLPWANPCVKMVVVLWFCSPRRANTNSIFTWCIYAILICLALRLLECMLLTMWASCNPVACWRGQPGHVHRLLLACLFFYFPIHPHWIRKWVSLLPMWGVGVVPLLLWGVGPGVWAGPPLLFVQRWKKFSADLPLVAWV